jgi:hypothetical protein
MTDTGAHRLFASQASDAMDRLRDSSRVIEGFGTHVVPAFSSVPHSQETLG